LIDAALARTGLSRFIRSGRPRHAFVLTRTQVSYVGPPAVRPARGAPAGPPLRLVSRALPPDAFSSGPAGAPVTRASLHASLARFVAEAGGRVPSASLVVPDDFVRVLTVDVEDPEGRPKEVEDIVVWKFGKTFGEPVPPLRISWQTAGAGRNGIRVVALAVPEEAAASWEAPFEKAGVRIGAVETASLAVSTLAVPALGGGGFLVWSDGVSATTLFYAGGGLRFLRTREMADLEEGLQEVRLAASFVSTEDPALGGACGAGPAGAGLVEAFRAFQTSEGGPAPAVLALPLLAPSARVAGATPGDEPALLAALGAMAGGE
jgi:hypothetical protein